MAYNFAEATVHVEGVSTAASVREALTLLEARYNLSAWLYVDRTPTGWSDVARYLTFSIPQVMGARRSRATFDNYRRDPSGLDDARFLDRLAGLNRLLSAEAIGDAGLELRVIAISQTGSVNIDTSGMGEPLSETVRHLWSRKERQENRRHTEEMNRRAERDSDRDYEQQVRMNLYDNIERIYGLLKDGAINEETAQALIQDIVPIQTRIDRSLEVRQVDYVDESFRAIGQSDGTLS